MLTLRTAVRKVERLAYSPDGSRIAVGGPTGTEVLDVSNHTTLALLAWARNCAVAFAPASNRLFIAHPDRPVSLLDYTDSAAPPDGVTLGQWWANHVHLLPTANGWVEADGGDVWSVRVVRNTSGFPPPHSVTWKYRDRPLFSRPRCLTALANPSRVVFLGTVPDAEDYNKFLYVLDGETGELRRRHRCGYGSVDHFTGSPCGGYLVGVRQSTLVVWDTAALHRPPRRWANDTRKQFTGVAFHPHGRYLLTASNDKSVKCWDLTTGRVVRSYDWAAGRMRSVAVAPDGLTAAAGSDENLVVFFDLDL